MHRVSMQDTIKISSSTRRVRTSRIFKSQRRYRRKQRPTTKLRLNQDHIARYSTVVQPYRRSSRRTRIQIDQEEKKKLINSQRTQSHSFLSILIINKSNAKIHGRKEQILCSRCVENASISAIQHSNHSRITSS